MLGDDLDVPGGVCENGSMVNGSMAYNLKKRHTKRVTTGYLDIPGS